MSSATYSFASDETKATVEIRSQFGFRDVYTITGDSYSLNIHVQHYDSNGAPSNTELYFVPEDSQTVSIGVC